MKTESWFSSVISLHVLFRAGECVKCLYYTFLESMPYPKRSKLFYQIMKNNLFQHSGPIRIVLVCYSNMVFLIGKFVAESSFSKGLTIQILQYHIYSGNVYYGYLFHCRYKIAQHQTMEDRIEAAKLWDGIPGTIFIDKMDNEASKQYAAIPSRRYIIVDGVIQFVGAWGPYSDLKEIVHWLDEYKQNKVCAN